MASLSTNESAFAEAVLTTLDSAVLCSDPSGCVTYLNPVAERMTGWSREDAQGRPIADVLKTIDDVISEPVADSLQLAIREDRLQVMARGRVLIRKDESGGVIHLSVAPISGKEKHRIGVVIILRDVGGKQLLDEQLLHLAQHDYLTDLPNRVLFDDRLNQAIALARRHRRTLAVLFVDCDNFKSVNDTFGHPCGDRLLSSVGKRLTSAVRRSDTVTRYGGDEFIILLSELKALEDAVVCAARILTELRKRYRVGKRDIHITASVGVAIYPIDGLDGETLINCADTALYEAKKSGGNTYRRFRSETNRQ